MSIKVGYINILESADSVTVTGTAVSGYPEYRLFDRLIDRQWRSDSTGTHTIIVDQGASGISDCDTLYIPSGHNFNGLDLTWQYSTNGVSYTDAVTAWTKSDTLLIFKQSTSVYTKRYWKLTVTSAVSAPQAAEIFMTQLHTLEAIPLYGLSKSQKRFVIRNESISGKVGFLYKGASKRSYSYTIVIANENDKTVLEALESECQMIKPFLFEDHQGNKMLAELLEPINYIPILMNHRGTADLVDYDGAYLADYVDAYCKTHNAEPMVVYRIELKIMEFL